MSKETEFLLGTAFALLTQCRQHMIKINDLDGVELIEDQYQSLSVGIADSFYQNKLKDK